MVKKLFFSTPARLKFLKTDNYESLLIKRIVQKLALCNFHIDFDLTINNKKAILTKSEKSSDKKKKLERRVSTLLGQNLLITQSSSMKPLKILNLKVILEYLLFIIQILTINFYLLMEE